MRNKTRLSLGVATAAAAIGAALVPATAAFAVPQVGTVTVTLPAVPAGWQQPGLQNGDVVTVSGTGFTADTPVAIVQCSTALGASDCDQDPAHLVLTTTDGTGNVPDTPFTVRTEAIGSASCEAASLCYIAVGSLDGGATTQGINSIQFDRIQVTPRSGLKNGQNVTIDGAGFTPNTDVYVGECSDLTGATSACDLGGLKVVHSDVDGAFSDLVFPVKTGTIGTGTCNPGSTCGLAATDNLIDPPSAHLGGAVIKFAPYVNKTVTVSAATTDKTVRTGQKFTIKGRTKVGTAGVNSLTVKLYKKAPSATKWIFVTSKKTSTINGVKGSYRFGQTGMKHNEWYKVVHPKQTIGLSIYLADTSPIVKITKV